MALMKQPRHQKIINAVFRGVAAQQVKYHKNELHKLDYLDRASKMIRIIAVCSEMAPRSLPKVSSEEDHRRLLETYARMKVDSLFPSRNSSNYLKRYNEYRKIYNAMIKELRKKLRKTNVAKEGAPLSQKEIDAVREFVGYDFTMTIRGRNEYHSNCVDALEKYSKQYLR